MAGGLARQLGLCAFDNVTAVDVDRTPSAPSWCDNGTFVAELKGAQARLWTAINGARGSKSLANIFHWHMSYSHATCSPRLLQVSTRKCGRTRLTTQRTRLPSQT